MKPLSLRWRIIVALIALGLGTTLVLSQLASYFLDLSLELKINIETGQALDDALVLAKESYDRRKTALTEAGQELNGSVMLAEAFRTGDIAPLQAFLADRGLRNTSLRFITEPDSLSDPFGDGAVEPLHVTRNLEHENLLDVIVPVSVDGTTVPALIATENLDELLRVKQAVQTYKHLQMKEGDLRTGFMRYLLVAAAGIVLMASLIGIRIGFQITGPIYALIKGTRELARDNLDYRIPPGRDDEIGLVINSFNRMGEDLQENRRQRVEAEKIAAWQEIARRLAHEIKNPLTPIQLTVQQIREFPGDDPEYRKLVEDCTEIVIEEVENLRALVQEFADFARMPSLSLGRHDLNNTITDVVRLYPEAEIRLELESELPALDLDIEKVRRALINLIENGLEASGQGGEMSIQTHHDGGSVHLRVADSGPGVAEEDRQRVFQPYVSTKKSGMGLGLAVVQSVVEDHGGQVTLTEGHGGGAQFEIVFQVPEGAGRETEIQT